MFSLQHHLAKLIRMHRVEFYGLGTQQTLPVQHSQSVSQSVSQTSILYTLGPVQIHHQNLVLLQPPLSNFHLNPQTVRTHGSLKTVQFSVIVENELKSHESLSFKRQFAEHKM